ncbi:MAG: hypothetical protein ACHQ2E_01410 [Gemmatimonadales bacterium]
MPLTRFPDHEDKRVFLSSVLTFNLPAPDAAHTDRLSVAAFWIDRGTPSASELSLEFAVDLIEHGALAIVIGGSDAEAAGALFEQAIAEGEFAQYPGEDVELLVQADSTLEECLFAAAEEAMPPDIYADQPWDLVVWCRSGDPSQPRLRSDLGRLTDLVDEIYDVGGEEE